jgi:hypothetical protein
VAQTTMYPAKAGSPQSTTTAILTDSATSIAVAELSVFPAVGTEGGNLVTFWSDSAWETCIYTAKASASGAGALTISRSGAAHASSTGGGIEWPSGTKCARNLTAYDLDAIKANIADHETRLGSAEGSITTLTSAAPLSKVSSGDTTAGHLDGKLVAGTGITMTKGNAGGNETLTIAVSGSGNMDPIVAALIFGRR